MQPFCPAYAHEIRSFETALRGGFSTRGVRVCMYARFWLAWGEGRVVQISTI